jgi:hypothetical protein
VHVQAPTVNLGKASAALGLGATTPDDSLPAGRTDEGAGRPGPVSLDARQEHADLATPSTGSDLTPTSTSAGSVPLEDHAVARQGEPDSTGTAMSPTPVDSGDPPSVGEPVVLAGIGTPQLIATALGLSVVVVVLWWLIGKFTLVVALAVAGLGVFAAAAIADETPGKSLTQRMNKRLVGLGSVPLLAALVCAVVAGLHHTTSEQLCTAYDDYVTVTAAASGDWSPFGADDSEWFDALEHVGKVAVDYRGGVETEAIRDSGKAVLDVADGTGESGDYITANVYEAAGALYPIDEFCYGGDSYGE